MLLTNNYMEQAKLDQMAEYYDEWWENPNDPRGAVFAKLNNFVYQRIPEGNSKLALDLGSGCGTIVDFLLKRNYDVTGVEYSGDAAKRLVVKYPEAKILQADLNVWNPEEVQYDLTTMVEVTQNFSPDELVALLKKVRHISKKVIITCPNYNSLQGRWVTWRKFKAPFVYLYKPKEFEEIVGQAGFKIGFRSGIGFLMPITLLSNFRIKLIPSWLVKWANMFMDKLLPRLCSLYYLELE